MRWREILAKSYRTHKSALKIRNEVWAFLLQEGILALTSGCATPNWDSVFWDHPDIQHTLHLHGHSLHASSLILPTDTIGERASKYFSLKKAMHRLEAAIVKENLGETLIKLLEHYNVEDPASLGVQMYSTENLLAKWLSNTKKIVLCGLGLNEYDHELMASISGPIHASGQKCEIVLINKAENSEEERKKREKAAGLFSCDPLRVRFLNTTPYKI